VRSALTAGVVLLLVSCASPFGRGDSPNAATGDTVPRNLKQFDYNSAKGSELHPGGAPQSGQIQLQADFRSNFYCGRSFVRLEVELRHESSGWIGTPTHLGDNLRPSVCPSGDCQVTPAVTLPVPLDGKRWIWRARIFRRFQNWDNHGNPPRRVCSVANTSDYTSSWVEFSPGKASFLAPTQFFEHRAPLAGITVVTGSVDAGETVADLGPEDGRSYTVHSGMGSPILSAVDVTATVEPRALRAIRVSLVSNTTRSCQQQIDIQRADDQWVRLHRKLIPANTPTTFRDLEPPGNPMDYVRTQGAVRPGAHVVVRVSCERTNFAFDHSLDALRIEFDGSVGDPDPPI
jgi:hypothetical protein